jgi:F0F1-type ATP synthase assembly protein I
MAMTSMADRVKAGYEIASGKPWRGDRAMNEAEREIKQRDKKIADNESDRQTVSAIRVSTWAIAVAVVLGLIVFGWVLLR